MDIDALTKIGREWKPSTLGEVLVDADGKIVGEVHKAIGTGYHANAKGGSLGTYYTATQAKRAVECSA